VGAKFIADANVRKQLVPVVLDAETSGGLLISMPKERADEALQELRTRGCAHADIVGKVLAGEPGVVRLVE
jgi:selenide,water dikinase